MKRRIVRMLGIVGILAVAAGAWWTTRAWQIRIVAEAAVPPQPSFTAQQAAIHAAVEAAETRVHGLFSATAGLEELSRVYHANGFLDEALRCYSGLERLQPKEPRWLHFHASILAGYGDCDAAVALWHRVVALAPTYINARLRLGDCELKLNNRDAAAAAYQGVLKLEPDNGYAQLGLARLAFEAENWSDAQARLERLVRQTDFTLGYDLIVSVYERTGQQEKADAIRGAQKASSAYRDPPDPWLDTIMDRCRDPYRLMLAAGSSARVGENSRAIALLGRALELDPKSTAAHFQLGMLYVSLSDFADARPQFEDCTRIWPEFADGWAQLSGVQEKLGDAAGAVRTVAEGLSHCPNSAGLHLMRARNLLKGGARDAAIAEFKESIRLRPNEALAYVELAQVYMSAGQLDEGAAMLRQALEGERGNPTALDVLAIYAISKSDKAEALHWWKQVLNQPRIAPEEVQKIAYAFQQQFGQPPPR